jgi:methyltransferase-like protein
MNTPHPTSNDDVPYPSSAYAQTHPDYLATVATLAGMAPPPVDRCRVLELGCKTGGNLLPMAEGFPGSEFVGIDFSARQVTAGQAALAEVGLKNVTLRQLSIMDFPADLGPFDYIIAHGVYSWVPPAVQDKLLAICGQHLTPNGVAFVSYNTYPGWHIRGMIREMMLYHIRRVADVPTRVVQARALVAFLAESLSGVPAPYGQQVRHEHQILRDKGDSYLFHEYLQEFNAPLYFHEFVERAAHHGLQYLGEAEGAAMLPRRLSAEGAATLGKRCHDVVAQEQHWDFIHNRAVRRTLLCRRDVPLRRQPKPEDLLPLQVAACAHCTSPHPAPQSSGVEEFRTPRGARFSTDHSLTRAALLHLANLYPRALPFDAMQAAARARLVGDAVVVQDSDAYARDTRLLAENLLQAFAAEVVELHVHALHLPAEPGDRPRAPGYARFQAKNGNQVTNLRHRVVPLDDLNRFLLRHLDGSRDRDALVDLLLRWGSETGKVVLRHGKPVTAPAEVRTVLAAALKGQLDTLARSALLVG